MRGPVEGDRVDTSVGSSEGPQGARRRGASRGRAWRGLGTGGRAGCAPRGGACWGGALSPGPTGQGAPPFTSSSSPFCGGAGGP